MIEAYKTEGFSFLIKAFNDPSYLEDLTGLTELHAQTVDCDVSHVDTSSLVMLDTKAINNSVLD